MKINTATVLIFTQSGATARKFESGVHVGQVGFFYFMRCDVGTLGQCFKMKGTQKLKLM
jgi:hypothetical protein